MVSTCPLLSQHLRCSWIYQYFRHRRLSQVRSLISKTSLPVFSMVGNGIPLRLHLRIRREIYSFKSNTLPTIQWGQAYLSQANTMAMYIMHIRMRARLLRSSCNKPPCPTTSSRHNITHHIRHSPHHHQYTDIRTVTDSHLDLRRREEVHDADSLE